MTSRPANLFGLFVLGTILMAAEPSNLPGSFFAEAGAVVGRPLTPGSYTGVARRTTRRTVAATSSASAAAASSQTSTVVVVDASADQQNAAPPAQPQQPAPVSAPQSALLPVGATLPSLPAGCGSTSVKDQTYFSCDGNWYRPAMQNGNIVYSVVADPR